MNLYTSQRHLAVLQCYNIVRRHCVMTWLDLIAFSSTGDLKFGGIVVHATCACALLLVRVSCWLCWLTRRVLRRTRAIGSVWTACYSVVGCDDILNIICTMVSGSVWYTGRPSPARALMEEGRGPPCSLSSTALHYVVVRWCHHCEWSSLFSFGGIVLAMMASLSSVWYGVVYGEDGGGW